MPSVEFFTESVKFKLVKPRIRTSWLNEVARKEKSEIRSLCYIFCSDDYLLGLNQQYLNHNTLTDIITFDYSEGKYLEGEIYISIDRVAENAQAFDVSFEKELNRVLVHGLLHLIGYKDKSKGEKELMRKKEDAYLSLLK